MNITRGRLREIIEEEVAAEEEMTHPEELRAQMPVEDLAQVVMKLIGSHPEGMEVLKQAFEGLYDVAVELPEEEEEQGYAPMGPEADPVIEPIGFREEILKALREYTERNPISHAQEVFEVELPFGVWAAEVEALGFEFGEDSPNPYDAWLSRMTPQQYAKGEVVEIDEVHSDKQRRWACAQADKPASERKDGLSKAEAEEMCSGPMK